MARSPKKDVDRDRKRHSNIRYQFARPIQIMAMSPSACLHICPAANRKTVYLGNECPPRAERGREGEVEARAPENGGPPGDTTRQRFSLSCYHANDAQLSLRTTLPSPPLPYRVGGNVLFRSFPRQICMTGKVRGECGIL